MGSTFITLLPQTILVVAACCFFLGGSFPVKRSWWGPLCLLVLALAGVGLWYTSTHVAVPPQQVAGELVIPAHAVVQDALSTLFQWLFLLMGLLFAGAAIREQAESEHTAEFYGLFLTLLSGVMLVAAADELILLFLGLELISIPTYVLLYMGRNDLPSQESAVKYFLLSVMSAAALLYGFSFLYGLTGSTSLSAVRDVLRLSYASMSDPANVAIPSRMGIVAMVLIFAGLGFKMAAVPFHFYAPDVYQGTTAWNAGLLAVVPKAAGFVALIRVASFAMPGFENSGQTIAMILALFTMTVGNVLALLQTNIRRLLAYSSIAHAGYMLIGIAVGFWDMQHPHLHVDPIFGFPNGVQACLFYLIAYCLVTVGLFAVLVYLAPPNKQVEHIDDLTGLWRTQPLAALCAALFLFSLAGMPPLPGFWGKLGIFSGALSVRGIGLAMTNPWFLALAIVGVLNSAIGAVYYLRIVGVMYLHEPLATPQPTGGRPALASVSVAAILTLALGLQAGPVLAYLRNIDVAGPGMVAQQHEQPATAQPAVAVNAPNR